jgi:hypothetical protein
MTLRHLRAALVVVAISPALPACSMQLQSILPTPQPALTWDGTWTGVYQCPAGVQRPEVLEIARRGGLLIATKVNTDDCIPAGTIVWEATLSKSVVSVNELPLASNAVIAVSPTQRVRGQLTIVTPDRMLLEGAGRSEFVRSTAAVPAANVAGAGPASTVAPAGGAPPPATGAIAPAADATKSAKACNIHAVDWKNLEYPERDNSVGTTFRLENGATMAGGADVTFDDTEYGDTDGNGLTEAFVSINMHNFQVDGDFGNVFVFEMDSNCALHHIGTTDMNNGKLTDKAYVVKLRKKRIEWRIVDGKLQKTEKK